MSAKLTKVERRRRLFKLYAANLRILFHDTIPEGEEVFLCPLCLNLFGPDAVEGDNPAVILAHCFPRSVGGKRATLSCAACDGRFAEGAVHLRSEKNLHEWSDGKRMLKGKASLGGAEIAVNISRKPDGGWHFAEVAKATNPDASKAAVEYMKQDDGQKQFAYELPGYDGARCNLGLVHAAYLTLFWMFGYEYARSSGGDWVRQQLVNNSTSTPCPIVVVSPPGPHNATLSDFVGIVRNQPDWPVFNVGFPSPAKDEQARLVLLPGFTKAALERYLASYAARTNVHATFTGVSVTKTPEKRLAKPSYRGMSTWWFNKETGMA